MKEKLKALSSHLRVFVGIKPTKCRGLFNDVAYGLHSHTRSAIEYNMAPLRDLEGRFHHSKTFAGAPQSWRCPFSDTLKPLFPGPGYSAAQRFRRGTTWTFSASLRELGRLRHSVELVPTIRRADRGIVSRARSRGTRGRQLPAYLCHSSSIVDHNS